MIYSIFWHLIFFSQLLYFSISKSIQYIVSIHFILYFFSLPLSSYDITCMFSKENTEKKNQL